MQQSQAFKSKRYSIEYMEALQQGINSISDYAIFLLDTEGNVKTWNKGAERIKGYTADEIIGQSFTRFYKSEAIEQHDPEKILAAAKANGHYEIEGWRVRKDGSTFWADVVITPIYNDKGVHTGFVKVTRDLTERKQAEHQLKQSEQNYRSLAELSPVGIFHIDSKRNIINANERTYEIMGLNREEVECLGWFGAIHPEDRLTVAKEWNNALNNHITFRAEFRFLHKNNAIVWVLCIARPVEERESQNIQYVQAIIDISERKKLEHLAAVEKAEQEQRQRAEEAERNKQWLTNYIDMFTHGLRNPLTGIQGSNNFIQEDISNIQKVLNEITQIPLAAKEKIEKYLNSIKEQTEAIAACTHHSTIITNDVLDLSRLDAKNKKLEIEPFCAQNVLTTLSKMFSAKMKEKALDLKLEMPEKELLVKGDNNCIEQVLTNLMTNAIKFTKKGYIKLSLIQQETTPSEIVLQFSVEDTGIGMTIDERQRLFNRFEQANKRVRHEYGGSGLGLYISKQLVNLMGGAITVESEKDKGSTFTFTVRCLQLSKEEQQQATQQIFNEDKGETISTETHDIKNILIVEDNEFNRKILIRYVSAEGHQYQVAENGLEALQKWKNAHFDVILMDIEMPKMDGLEATKKIRYEEASSNKPFTPIIGLSGNARQEQKEEALAVGMNDYLIKPYKQAQIYQAIANSLNSQNIKSNEYQSISVKSENTITPVTTTYPSSLFSLTQETTGFFNANKIEKTKQVEKALENAIN